MPKTLLRAENVSISYVLGESEYKVVDRISFSVQQNEFLSIIGPSGCGKSSLIRVMIGLQEASSGKVVFLGKEVRGPPEGMSMVFQNIALIPWKTALENVMLAMTNEQLSSSERESKAIDALDLVHLKGFEHAYPAELSGGMKQRVGVARAIVVNPEILLMDEPFSSLDELTAEELRGELHNILTDKKMPVKSVVLVSHNVEEVVELSDRVLVMSKPPSKIVDIARIRLPYPRNKRSRGFESSVDRIMSSLYIAEK